MGRVEIVTLSTPFDSPHFFLSSGSFNMVLLWAIARQKKTPALQATVGSVDFAKLLDY